MSLSEQIDQVSDPGLRELAAEIRTYESKLTEWVPREGQYVLIRGREVVGFFWDYAPAIQTGYARFGTGTPFLVKRIERQEHVQRFPRLFASPVKPVHVPSSAQSANIDAPQSSSALCLNERLDPSPHERRSDH